MKKLKKDSAGWALRTELVRFVSVDDTRSTERRERKAYIARTLIALLLDLKLFCQILLLLPLNCCSNGLIVE